MCVFVRVVCACCVRVRCLSTTTAAAAAAVDVVTYIFFWVLFRLICWWFGCSIWFELVGWLVGWRLRGERGVFFV